MASSSSATAASDREEEEDFYGGGSGWVEARTTCEHLPSLSSDLLHIPPPGSDCTREADVLGRYERSHKSRKFKNERSEIRCHHPAENWLCLSCKDVLCSRFINKHMLTHHKVTGHCLALSYSDLSVWCFACEAYLDAQVILQLRPVYETAHLMKFGATPPVQPIEFLQVGLQSP